MGIKSINFTTYSEVIETIEQLKAKKITNKVLHSHPSPMFWNHHCSFDDFMSERQSNIKKSPKLLALYIALPFCLKTNPPNCGYCLFPHVDYTSKADLETYLKYLKIEGEIYKPYLKYDQVTSIYFGGGTPNIYPEMYYWEIKKIINAQFQNLNNDVEVTFEGTPNLFNKEKLKTLKAIGINRISLGVQQLNPELIKLSGRRQNPKHVLKIIQLCRELDLKVSADMIFGWPGQTVNSLLNDLKQLTKAKISHITNYELNIGGRSDFSRNRRNALPSNEENLSMYLTLQKFLMDEGYIQISINDFARINGDQSNVFKFEESMRKPWDVNGQNNGYDMWGWGFGGISYFTGTPQNPGSVFMNSIRLSEYYDALKNKKPPIKKVFNYTEEDIRICWIFQSLQSLKVNKKAYTSIFNSDVVNDHQIIWQALDKLKWIRINEENIHLEGIGMYHLPLIQSLLSATRMEEIKAG